MALLPLDEFEVPQVEDQPIFLAIHSIGLESIHPDFPATWELPPIFATLAQIAGLPQSEMEKTWNVGVGMVAAVAPESLTESLATLADQGIQAWHAGRVTRPTDKEAPQGTPTPRAALVGKYRNL